jgi:hypothetical protein
MEQKRIIAIQSSFFLIKKEAVFLQAASSDFFNAVQLEFIRVTQGYWLSRTSF